MSDTIAEMQSGAQITTLVPLADCYIHKLNTRSEPPPADIEALAESISELGLLQNIAGWLDPKSPADIAWKIGIVAGGRRLRALQMLAEKAGDDPATVMVPVKLARDEDTARLWASAENTARQALHPADEVRAYGRMMRAGADPNAIARAFAVSERHVRQRLKLASLPATALAALREGRISLDQAAALTFGRSSEVIEAQLNKVLTSQWSVGASQIRQSLQEASIGSNDPRVRLVGLDAYRAMGGRVIEDLFSDSAQLLDEDILDDLAAAHLTKAAEAERLKGWAEVQIGKPCESWETPKGMVRIWPRRKDLPQGDQEELDQLEERGGKEELTEAEIDRMEELEARATGFDDDDIAASTVWLQIDRDGKITTFGPWKPISRDTGGASDAGVTRLETKAPPQSLLDDLARIRLAALQHRAASQPELLLDLLAWQLSGETSPYSASLNVTANRQNITPEKSDGLELPGTLADPGDQREHQTAEGFAAFRALGKKHRNEVLARGLARTLGPAHEMRAILAATLRPAPREIWTPTATGYFSRLPAPHLDAIWRDLVPEDRMDPADFEKLKKAEKAKELEKLFNNADFREALGLSREQNNRIDTWLPEQLQWPALEGEE